MYLDVDLDSPINFNPIEWKHLLLFTSFQKLKDLSLAAALSVLSISIIYLVIPTFNVSIAILAIGVHYAIAGVMTGISGRGSITPIHSYLVRDALREMTTRLCKENLADICWEFWKTRSHRTEQKSHIFRLIRLALIFDWQRHAHYLPFLPPQQEQAIPITTAAGVYRCMDIWQWNVERGGRLRSPYLRAYLCGPALKIGHACLC